MQNLLLIPLFQFNPYRTSFWDSDFGIYLKIVLVLIVIIFIFRKAKKNYHSKWNILIDNFKFSSHDFYNKLKEELNKKNITHIYYDDIKHNIGGIGSGQRRYLRIEWQDYYYDICVAPFGTGLFVSWWLFYQNPPMKIFLQKIPFIGMWLGEAFFPITYYKSDTASMFMKYTHNIVQKVIDDITNDQGIRAITEEERKPILNTDDIFKR